MKNNRFIYVVKKIDFEVYVWTIALIILAFSNPDTSHFKVCPIANLGFEWCPGCGLGRSINLLFSGRVANSFEMHPLGILTVLILSYRVISLVKFNLKF